MRVEVNNVEMKSNNDTNDRSADWLLSMWSCQVVHSKPLVAGSTWTLNRSRRRVAVALRNEHVVRAPSTMHSLCARRIVHHDRAVARLTRRLPLIRAGARLTTPERNTTGTSSLALHANIGSGQLHKQTSIFVYGLFFSDQLRHTVIQNKYI